MEATILAIVNKLDPSSLILLLSLLGGWKLINKSMDKFAAHGDKVTESLSSIAHDTSALRVDMATIASRVDGHERRINKLEIS